MFQPGDFDFEKSKEDGYLTGQILIAMPQLQDSFFAKSLVYLCAHNEEGAMGIVLNKLMPSMKFIELLEQLKIEHPNIPEIVNAKVHFGGPVETARGFVLHSRDYIKEGSMMLPNNIAVTTTVEVLRDIANDEGPESSMIALGYAGWTAGQLDREIQSNGWLSVDPDEDLLFGPHIDKKWEHAMKKLGVSVDMLTVESGEA